ncbi:MAG: peptidoglycan DD-metalloendopeptidase family protein [Gammaproteobacteria bacterium]
MYALIEMRVLRILLYALIWIMTGCTVASRPKSMLPALPYERDLTQGPGYYEVKKGDTLYSIGFRSGYGYRTLALWNDIPPPYTIQIGQKIKLFEPAQKEKNFKRKKSLTKTLGKKRNTSQKKPIISSDNKNLLKLHWQWPIKGRIVKNFSQTGSKGIDIDADWGQSVRAAEAGKVVYSGNGLIGYGNLLIIKHNEMYLSAYAYNSSLLVNEGQAVDKKQIIAKVGKLGSGQPALHFEIRKNGKPVNPINYLPEK